MFSLPLLASLATSVLYGCPAADDAPERSIGRADSSSVAHFVLKRVP